MTTYISRQIKLQVSEEQNGEKLLFKRGDREVKFEEVAELNEEGSAKFAIQAPVTDQDLMAGLTITTARILYIESDVELTVKLADTGDTGFTIKPVVTADAATKRGTLYLEGEFTHVYVTIAGTDIANIVMGVVGA